MLCALGLDSEAWAELCEQIHNQQYGVGRTHEDRMLHGEHRISPATPGNQQRTKPQRTHGTDICKGKRGAGIETGEVGNVHKSMILYSR